MRGFRGVSRALNSIAREQRRAQSAARSIQQARSRDERIIAKVAQQDYATSRAAQAAAMSAAVEKQIEDILSILPGAAEKTFAIEFSTFKKKPKKIPFAPCGLDAPDHKPNKEIFQPRPLNVFKRMIPALVRRHEQETSAAEERFQAALAEYIVKANARKRKLAENKKKHTERIQVELRNVEEHNTLIDAMEAQYRERSPEAVIKYFIAVFERDTIFEDRGTNVQVAYVPESGQLVVEYELPKIDVIPPESGYKYIKKSDSIEPVARKSSDIKKLYREVLTQLACRALKVTVDADFAKAVDVVVLNGFVDTTHPGTGKRIRPAIISVSASMAELAQIDFTKVNAGACLATLKALVSRSAHELEPVRPIVNFNMVDPRFVDKDDVLSGLDSRPNLAELTPNEFEILMTNLFEKMGLETRLTQASRDGGVDCVAWDMRPVIGGKVVIQAKRYKNTVGVSAVRDLFGTMHNEGAAKGILVTTSGFGASTYEFSKNKPIELVTGSNLLSMLSEYAGINAKIEFPQDWQDEDGRMD